MHFRDKVKLIRMDDLLDKCLHSVCSYFIEDFCICVHKVYCETISHRNDCITKI